MRHWSPVVPRGDDPALRAPQRTQRRRRRRQPADEPLGHLLASLFHLVLHAWHGPGLWQRRLAGQNRTLSTNVSATRHFEPSPSNELTRSRLARLWSSLRRKGRQRFRFNPSWEGCRFWISVVSKDFEEAGVTAEGSANVAGEALLRYWINPEGSASREMREGSFDAS